MTISDSNYVNFPGDPAPTIEEPNKVDDFDDFLEFGDSLTIGDEGFYNADWKLQNTPPYDGGLCSTPLSWDPPKASFEPKQENLRPIYTSATSTLSLAQQEQLRSIAMPDILRYQKRHSPHSASRSRTFKSSSAASPDQQDSSRKRKSSASADDDDDDDEDGAEGQPPPVKKTAHNMIEKRYRTNLNDKIAALRDSVPSLRAGKMNAKGERNNEEKEDLHGLTPAHKLNKVSSIYPSHSRLADIVKATVLSKATEYIRHLEKRNTRLNEENTSMKARIAAFERLFMAGSMGFNPIPPTNPNPYVQQQFMSVQNSGELTPDVSPVGMIEVPDDIKRLHAGANQMNQQTYAVPQEKYRPANHVAAGQNGWQNGGGYLGKMMVGSLAGLMILEGFAEREQDGEEPNSRGLFAVPAQFLGHLGRSLGRSTDISILGYHSPSGQTLAFLRMLLVLGTLLYIFIPSLFESRPKKAKSNGKMQTTSLVSVPSLASPIQVRQQAWLTAIQTVWVPKHNFFLEAASLCLKMAKLSLRNVVGWYGYSLLTGLSEQQEAARVKAWSIALDAQLAGGDIKINKSRLILTLIASGTLPDTPARLMLKALHVRVLLWEYGRAGFDGIFLFQEFAAKLARWKWDEARRLQQIIVHMGKSSGEQDADRLPPHLVALLEFECDEVLVDGIAQRLYNLAFNLPTTHKITGSSDGMDIIVNDFAIRSPLDAAAAWFSSLKLQQSLATALGNQGEVDDDILSDINVAINTAPIGSSAQIRAVVARANLSETDRSADIANAIQSLTPLKPNDANNFTSVPTFINNNTSISSSPDLRLSLHCAIATAHLQRFSTPSSADLKSAYHIINALQPTRLSLLGFTAAFKLMRTLAQHEVAAIECRCALENLAGTLRIWIGGRNGFESELSRSTKEEVVERCLAVTKQCLGMEGDAGYASMSEKEEIVDDE
jgi:hypothetical protein